MNWAIGTVCSLEMPPYVLKTSGLAVTMHLVLGLQCASTQFYFRLYCNYLPRVAKRRQFISKSFTEDFSVVEPISSSQSLVSSSALSGTSLSLEIEMCDDRTSALFTSDILCIRQNSASCMLTN